MSKRADKGISLPEVLFTILVLGLVAAAVVPQAVYSSGVRTTECQANVALLNAKIDRWVAEHDGRRPAGQGEFTWIVNKDKECFPDRLPKCPYGRPYAYDAATGHVVSHRH